VYPEIHLGPVTLQTFGICFALAFLAAGALVWKRFGELGKPHDWGYEMGFWQLRDRVRAGCLFALYLMYAGTERFLVEFLRRNTRDSLGLTAAQLESLVMLIVGALWIAIVVERHGGIGGPAANESRDALQPAH